MIFLKRAVRVLIFGGLAFLCFYVLPHRFYETTIPFQKGRDRFMLMFFVFGIPPILTTISGFFAYAVPSVSGSKILGGRSAAKNVPFFVVPALIVIACVWATAGLAWVFTDDYISHRKIIWQSSCNVMAMSRKGEVYLSCGSEKIIYTELPLKELVPVQSELRNMSFFCASFAAEPKEYQCTVSRMKIPETLTTRFVQL